MVRRIAHPDSFYYGSNDGGEDWFTMDKIEAAKWSSEARAQDFICRKKKLINWEVVEYEAPK